ncbi:hypothetical protein [Mycobacteroides abscessus]|nr:hypothetical protein [Mycobacteroides abscessus]
MPVTLSYVRQATARCQLKGTKMGGALFFSTRGLFDWIMARYDEAAS